MQRFLEITELVEHVFEYSERSALAAFARTCHSLSELALDTLWGIHGDFNALMALLPDDIELEIADFTEYPASLSPSFSRELIASDWELLDRHIHRLRKVEISAENISQESLNHLCATCPSEFLFPNLRVLKFSLYATAESEITINLAKIFNPKLQVLQVEQTPDDDDVHTLFLPAVSLLPTRCPNLKEITWGRDDNPEIKSLSDVICQYGALERLHITQQMLPVHVTSHILTLPHITELEWHCDDIEPYTPDSTLVFPLLRSWTQESETIDPVFSVLVRLHQQTKLEDFSLRLARLHGSDDMQKVLDMMQNRLDPSALQVFDLYYDTCTPSIRNDLIQLTPLFAFHDLRSLSISSFDNSSEMRVDVDDARLALLASCWPRLRYLHLPTDPIRVTVNGLLALLHGCPNLQDLELQFTLSVAGLETPLQDRTYPKLRALNVGKSLVKDPTGVEAKFVDRLLPNLSPIRYSDEGQDQEEWKKTNLYFRSRLQKSLRAGV